MKRTGNPLHLYSMSAQENNPFAVEFQERFYRIFSHIRRHCHRIKIKSRLAGIEKCLGILCRCVPDISPLGIGNGKYFKIFKVLDCPGQALPSFDTITFIKSKIGFISNGKVMRGINDLLVEFKSRIFSLEKMLRDFGKIRVKSYAEKGSFFSDDWIKSDRS